VPDKLIAVILGCGKFAPSAMNIQLWHFTVVTKREVLAMIDKEVKTVMVTETDDYSRINSANSAYDTFRTVPRAIIVSGMIAIKYGESDSANAVENMAIEAHSLDLGGCYIASFRCAFLGANSEKLLKLLQIPEGYEPYFAFAIGYPHIKPIILK